MIDFIGKKRWYFLGSALFILLGIIFLALFGLNIGLEFKSGTMRTFLFSEEVGESELREALSDRGFPEAMIQRSSKEVFFLKLRLEEEEREAIEDAFGPVRIWNFESGQALEFLGKRPSLEELKAKLEELGLKAEPSKLSLDAYLVKTRKISPEEEEMLERALEDAFGDLAVADFYEVSPIFAFERVRNTMIAVAIGAVGVLIYIALAFRRLPKPFRYGTCAVIALAHDVLVVLGMFALLGKIMGVEVNSMFVIAVLTIIGYSVNDTVVVFDRIRENMLRGVARDLATVANMSLTETLGRSLNTSLTTLLVILALLLIGGETLRSMVLAMLIGIISGTYSSICIAAPLLVAWERGEIGRFFRFFRRA